MQEVVLNYVCARVVYFAPSTLVIDSVGPVQGGLATAFDLAAFWFSMVAPVKKSVNHSRIVASMRETGWKQKQQEVCLRSDSTV